LTPVNQPSGLNALMVGPDYLWAPPAILRGGSTKVAKHIDYLK
jgi:hypothetical protein